MVTSSIDPGKTRYSPPLLIFPWLAPLVINFAIVNGGIEIQLYRHNRLLRNWQPSKLRRILPKALAQWIEDHHISADPQPYPLVKQLWQQLLPLASKRLIIDSSALAELAEVSQPQDFTLTWTINRSSTCIEGRYEGADHYLGMGWFQQGKKVWSLKNTPSIAIDAQLKNLTVPLQQIVFLLNSIIPDLRYYLPTRADFQIVTDFALQVTVLDGQSSELVLALHCNYPQLLPAIQVPQLYDTLLANHAIVHFPQQALTPVVAQLLGKNSPITIQGANIPFFIREQLPTLLHYHQISDDMAAKIAAFSATSVTPSPPISLQHNPVPGGSQQPSVQPAANIPPNDEASTPASPPKRMPEPAKAALTKVRRQAPTKTVPEPVKSSSPPDKQPVIQLNQEVILKLHQDSEQLQDRLSIVTDELPVLILPPEPPVAKPEEPAVKNMTGSAPDVDEDWQIILQQWQSEHWEVIQLLYQEQSTQLSAVEHKVHRPVSRLIDEINAPVDEQLGDLLIDPDTRTLSSHLHTVAGSLVSWYCSATKQIGEGSYFHERA